MRCSGRVDTVTPRAPWNWELPLTIDPGRKSQSLGHIAASRRLCHSVAICLGRRAGIEMTPSLCPRDRFQGIRVEATLSLPAHPGETVKPFTVAPCGPDSALADWAPRADYSGAHRRIRGLVCHSTETVVFSEPLTCLSLSRAWLRPDVPFPFTNFPCVGLGSHAESGPRADPCGAPRRIRGLRLSLHGFVSVRGLCLSLHGRGLVCHSTGAEAVDFVCHFTFSRS